MVSSAEMAPASRSTSAGLEHTKWSLEVVDKDNNSIVWDDEFETDDEAYAEFIRSVDTEGLDGILRDPTRLH